MLASLSVSDFEPLVGSTFTISLDAAPAELVLVEAKRLGEGGGAGEREPFSLLFRGPLDLLKEQQICRLEHPALNALDVFLVPLQPDADGSLLEAVFA